MGDPKAAGYPESGHETGTGFADTRRRPHFLGLIGGKCPSFSLVGPGWSFRIIAPHSSGFAIELCCTSRPGKAWQGLLVVQWWKLLGATGADHFTVPFIIPFLS